jgi:hypothetical protein
MVGAMMTNKERRRTGWSEANNLEKLLEQSTELADGGAKNILVEHLWGNQASQANTFASGESKNQWHTTNDESINNQY